MEDPLLEQLVADAESILSELGVTNDQAADRAMGADSLDLEADREEHLRAALIAELDRRHGPTSADPESSAWVAEEWADRGDAGVDDLRDR
jgi:hypothetical protein